MTYIQSPRTSAARLHRLPPMNAANADVESILSYINRIAISHQVETRCLNEQLVQPEVNASCAHQETSNPYKAKRTFSFKKLLFDPKYFNAIQKLTCRNDLETLTLIHWRPAVSFYKRVRTYRAWCPECHRDSINNGEAPYDKLTWTLPDVRYCNTHMRLLRENCPSCSFQIPVFYAPTDLSFCPFCGSSLLDKKIEMKVLNPLQQSYEEWKTLNVEQLIMIMPVLTEVDFCRASDAFVDSIPLFFNGNPREMDRELGLLYGRGKKLSEKISKPFLQELLQLSRFCSIPSIVDIFTNGLQNAAPRQFYPYRTEDIEQTKVVVTYKSSTTPPFKRPEDIVASESPSAKQPLTEDESAVIANLEVALEKLDCCTTQVKENLMAIGLQI